ncbi:MAG: HEPN domain-containing protein [Methanothrix sp.]|nr:HEPN domain-containing protein [Methanothrix sp.]MDD4448406.1 HEPN domain-containing protein [Methanothrix sp.]
MSIQKKLGKNPKTIDKNIFLKLTKEICLGVSKISPGIARSFLSTKANRNIMIIERSDGIIQFDHNACVNLEKAINLVKYDPVYIACLSEEIIREKYKDLIISLFLANVNSDQELKVRLNSFLAELRTSVKEYRILMPIEQLELSDLEEVKIGTVRLVPFCSLKAENEDLSRSVIKGDDENRIWGEVFIRAESTEAISKGQYEIEQVINLLRAYVPILFHKEHNIKVGLIKYDPNKYHEYLTIGDSGLTGGKIYLGPFGKYKLSKNRYEDLTASYCLNEISELLSKSPSSRSDLENSIIIAIRWIGLGIDDEVVSDKFLKYSIALECLLTPRGEKGDKADPISKRASFLLGKTESECLEIISELKLLYDIRSTIVHQGCEAEEEEIIKDSVQKMYYYSMSTLLKLSGKTKEPGAWNDIQCLDNQMNLQMFAR